MTASDISIVVTFGFTLALVPVTLLVQAQSLEAAYANDTKPISEAKQFSQPAEPTFPPLGQSSGESRPRPLRNSIGIGGSIGLSDSRGSGMSGFAILSRLGFSDSLSLRSASVFGDRTVNTFALTFDFPIRGNSGQTRFIPFLGGGVVLDSDYSFGDLEVNGLISGGIDIPLSRRFTATVMIDVDFIDDTNLGLLLGVGYNF